MRPSTVKTDRIGAEIIVRAAMGMRQVVPPITDTDVLGASLSLMWSQLEYAIRCATQIRNRLHAAMLKSDLSFEVAVEQSCVWQLAVLARLGGAAGRRSYSAIHANADAGGIIARHGVECG